MKIKCKIVILGKLFTEIERMMSYQIQLASIATTFPPAD